MQTYETQIGTTVVNLALDPEKRLIVGTALTPGGTPVAVELPCPYTPDTIAPYWIDFAHAAAAAANLAAPTPPDADQPQDPPPTTTKPPKPEP